MENNILKERFSLYKLIRYAGGLACVIAFQSALFPLLILYKISNSEHLKMTESLSVFFDNRFSGIGRHITRTFAYIFTERIQKTSFLLFLGV